MVKLSMAMNFMTKIELSNNFHEGFAWILINFYLPSMLNLPLIVSGNLGHIRYYLKKLLFSPVVMLVLQLIQTPSFELQVVFSAWKQSSILFSLPLHDT